MKGSVSVGRSRRSDGGEAFEALMDGALDALFGFACALAPRPEADDLTQTACLRALEHRNGFEPGSNFKTWIFTILKNEFVSRHRRERRRAELRLDLTIPVGADGDDGLETALIEAQWNAEVRDAVVALPESFRMPVYLKDVAGFAYREIAEITDVPLGTVMSRLARGRALLRVALVKQARERGVLRAATSRSVSG
jgi:RNA polymerase sigma-70 factor (ECF subfamily)